MGREGRAPMMGSVPFRGETPESWRTQREVRGPRQWHPAVTHLQSCEGQTSVVSAPRSWYFVPTKRPTSPLKIPPYQTTCCSWTGWAKARQPPAPDACTCRSHCLECPLPGPLCPRADLAPQDDNTAATSSLGFSPSVPTLQPLAPMSHPPRCIPG